MKVATRRLLEEQIAAFVVPGRGEKNNAMWHVTQLFHSNLADCRAACEMSVQCAQCVVCVCV